MFLYSNLNNNIYYLILTSLILLTKIAYSSLECIQEKNYCKECNITSQLCQKCSNISFYPDQNGGCSSSQNCLISKEGICLKCDNNFFLSEDNQCSKANFCLKTNKENLKCLICKPGFILTNNGECSFTKNCLKANPKTSVCLECESNYYYDLDNYECKSNLINDKLNFCLKVFNNNCIECIPNYYLSIDNQCVNTKNCKISKNGICTNCTYGYYLSLKDKKCVETDNCLYVNSNSECQECKEEYYYDKSLHKCILRDEKNSNLINCKIVLNKNECYRCDKDYYLNMTDLLCYKNTEINNKFYKCSRTDNNALNCEECVNNYYLGSKNKKCSEIQGCSLYENNQCFSCENNLCHDLKSDLCFPMKITNETNNKEFNKFCINCYETNPEGNSCSKCAEGYYIGENGVCINTYNCEEAFEAKCLKCKDNYCLNEENSCLLTEINNCLKCENGDIYNTKCTKCNPGFVLNENNICLKCGNDCKTCLNENNCLECFDGFYLSKNENNEESDKYLCKKCKEGCKRCLNENECLTCDDNYYEEKENGEIKCIICPEGCDDCTNKFNCIKCKNDYKLISIKGENYCIRTKRINDW